jgi:signal peptidase I
MNFLSLRRENDTQMKPALDIKREGALPLSSRKLENLLRGVLEKGASFRFQAKGFSMSPFIKDGDLLTITPLLESPPRFGDVVVFVHLGTGKLTIHRIIGKKVGSYLTKGDNAPERDGFIPKADILGRVTNVERSGKCISLGLGPDRFIIAFVIRTGLLPLLNPLWRLVHFFMKSRHRE